MKVVDIYLLIYAINKDTPHHIKAKKWIEDSFTHLATLDPEIAALIRYKQKAIMNQVHG